MRSRLRELTFRLRGTLRASAPVLKRRAGSLEALDARLSPEARARRDELARRYDLMRWGKAFTPGELHEALYVLDLLDQHLPADTRAPGLDVGTKTGVHLPALAARVPGRWDGVELDAHRRYLTLATRRGWALDLLRDFPECRYVAGSLLELTAPYGCITWTLPFVTPGPLEAWGLPGRFYEPERLLAHAWRLLAPGGLLFVVNQGAREAEAQGTLFRALGIEARALGPLVSPLSPFRRERVGWLARAPLSPRASG